MKSNLEILARMESLLDEIATNNVPQRAAAGSEAVKLSAMLISRAQNALCEQYCLEYDLHIRRLSDNDIDPTQKHTDLIGALQAVTKLRSSHGFNLP